MPRGPRGEKRPADGGDVWTWTALDADSKLIISWMVGDRDAEAASLFISDLKNHLACVQRSAAPCRGLRRGRNLDKL